MPVTFSRIRHQPRFRRLRVTSNDRITPRMARIVVEGDDLEGFESPGFDDHIRLFFPPAGATSVPQPDESGPSIVWPGEKPLTRDYTPRAFDAARRRLTLDFVLHAGGLASDWAEAARPGDELCIGGPKGSFIVSGEADWQLLVGDATALPAISRRLEELPAGSPAEAVIEVASADEVQNLRTGAAAKVSWLHNDRGETLSDWLSNLQLPSGEGFVFFAAEAAVVAEARHRFAALGLPPENMRASNYWKRA